MGYTITKTDIEIHLTTEDIAKSFCGLSDEEQAHVINLIGAEFQSWENAGGIMQAFWMVDHDILTEEGRWFIERAHEGLGDQPFREAANAK